ncbi:hypothetical protein BFAG_04712 [Bacteroides fragilis 3_1_12]|uniref:Uncharacterized protein n=1 Tax=Bacteroides fragilis 3_1_12 TaxID=457424 RepID=A0ABN0BSU6_BACFG|nr:hypothetical protein BFAG_04712 [Bacteroides fragilis 3_1_12]
MNYKCKSIKTYAHILEVRKFFVFKIFVWYKYENSRIHTLIFESLSFSLVYDIFGRGSESYLYA